MKRLDDYNNFKFTLINVYTCTYTSIEGAFGMVLRLIL